MPDRREQSERRSRWARRRDRRRERAQRAVVIELTCDQLQIAALERSSGEQPDRVSLAAYPWREKAATLNSDEGLAELTAALRAAARAHSMQGADVRLVLSGEFCVSRTIRGTADHVRAELQQLEARSRLYLSLGPGEKVLVSHVKSLNARHAHALAAVCNRATLETIHAAADAAGIAVRSIEPSLSAINRAVARMPGAPGTPYLVVQLDGAAIEIGVCHEGQLLLDYRPGGSTKLADLPALLDNHLTRLARHAGRCLGTAPPQLDRAYLCGDSEAVDAALNHFREVSSLSVQPVRPEDIQATWQFDDGDGSRATAAALGGLLACYLPELDRDAPNLMTHIISRQQKPLRPQLVRFAFPLAATLLAAIGLQVVNVQQTTAIDRMEAELSRLAGADRRASEIRLQLLSTQRRLAELNKLAEQLPPGIGGDQIARLAQCMPNDVWLSRLEIQDGASIRLEGLSYLEAGVYDFVRWLEQAPGLQDVALRQTNPASSASGPATSFELEMTVADPAPPQNQPVTQLARHE